jgi:hypothetical protein
LANASAPAVILSALLGCDAVTTRANKDPASQQAAAVIGSRPASWKKQPKQQTDGGGKGSAHKPQEPEMHWFFPVVWGKNAKIDRRK